MNTVIFTGRLGRAPETKYTTAGMAITTFSLAVSDGYGDKQKTYWPNFVCFDKTAELIANSLDKGSHILVDARYTEDHWDDKEGKKRMAVKFIVNRFEFLDSKKKEPAANNTPESFGQVVDDSPVPF